MTTATNNEILSNVRMALRFVGAEVVERPMPPVVVQGDRSFYNVTAHSVVLAVNAAPTTLAHELAHSQQADHSPVAYYDDGKVNAAAWLADYREAEAVAVEVLAPLVSIEKWPVCAAAIEDAGVSGPDRAKWAGWIFTSTGNDAKPGYLPRSARRAMNAARLACQA